MAKLGWKMCQGPPNLAKDCISSKCIHKNVVKRFQKGSRIWQSIGKGWSILESSCQQWNLGNGQSISFWHDNWLGVGPIRSFVSDLLNYNELNASVRECWHSGDWNGLSFSLDLPMHISQRILNFDWHPSDGSDQPFSSFVKTQIFSLKQAFHHITVSNHEKVKDISWVWDGRHPPKLKNIVSNPTCNLCDSFDETVIHMLRDCEYALNI